jgi:two-component system sensor histidine kinase KdpD
MSDDARDDREGRPDPDRLIEEARAEESRAGRGRLRIFFGACAGVGKTYAMLEQGRQKRRSAMDVVAGWVETHGRKETEALLEGLEILPPRRLDYRGVPQREFDLDAALARRPSILLLDELAHTNVPGSRHVKRWQDAEELLQAGIDVYTTVNVQHVESLNDIVAQVTGVTVRETVPDHILETADEIEFIDIPPDDLLQRFREGKVYVPAQAERAMRSFFTKANLVALRELALRTAAERVDDQMRRLRGTERIESVWPVTERILVAISASPAAARVVLAAQRMAAGLRAPWFVVFIETPASVQLTQADRDRVDSTLALAERLGAETAILRGERPADEILAYARERNVTKIVVGKPTRPWWRYRLFGSVVDELMRRSDDIDVYVIRGRAQDAAPAARRPLRPISPVRAYLYAAAATAATTALAAALFERFALVDVSMLLILMIVFVAALLGRGPSILASILGVAAFDFFFVPPRMTFRVFDAAYVLTFVVMLAVALVISTLTVRLRQQVEASRFRETRTASLYGMSRDLSRAASVDEIVHAAETRIAEVLHTEVWILLAGKEGTLQRAPGGVTSGFPLSEKERSVAQWAFDHAALAGRGTATLRAAQAVYVPMIGAGGPVGVMGLFPSEGGETLGPERLHMVEALANQTALALERALLERETREARVNIEAEKLRSALLSSVSHDLRTPLAAITGAASSLLDPTVTFDAATRIELLQSIYGESERLGRLVANLLHMTRLESGAVEIRREWQPIDEVIGSALNHLERHLAERRVSVRLPEGICMAPMDPVLIEQVLVNLVENAVRYSPEGTEIEIRAAREDDRLMVEVADRGPGIPDSEKTRIFEKFHRLEERSRGVGLGLAICRSVMEAHGGSIRVEDREGGGAVFRIVLPLTGKSPEPPAAEKEDPSEVNRA